MRFYINTLLLLLALGCVGSWALAGEPQKTESPVDEAESDRIGERFAGVYTIGCQEDIATEKTVMTKDTE